MGLENLLLSWLTHVAGGWKLQCRTMWASFHRTLHNMVTKFLPRASDLREGERERDNQDEKCGIFASNLGGDVSSLLLAHRPNGVQWDCRREA